MATADRDFPGSHGRGSRFTPFDNGTPEGVLGAGDDVAATWFFETATGGTLFTQAIAGALTGTGLVTKRTRKGALLGTVTVSATIIKRVRSVSTLRGTVTAAGNISRRARKVTIGSITGSGVIRRKASIRTLGAITASSIVSRKTIRKLIGSITASASTALRIRFTKLLTGSLTATSGLTWLFMPGANTSSVGSTLVVLRRFLGRR